MGKDDSKTNHVKLKWEFLPLTLIAEKTDEEVLNPDLESVPQHVIDHCRKLLSISGKKVCVYYVDIATDDIALKDGEIIDYTGIVKKRGCEEHRCHTNSAKLWRRHPKKYKLATGYGLDEDIWIGHSWLLNAKKQIVETTYPFELYYGVVMDTVEAEKFCKTVLKEE
jgi:hypothetical protein